MTTSLKKLSLELERARKCLETARQHPDFGCDVCGPYGHYFFLCWSAARVACLAFLGLHGEQLSNEQSYDLSAIVVRCTHHSTTFGEFMDAASRFQLSEDFDRVPTQGERDEAIELAERIMACIESAAMSHS